MLLNIIFICLGFLLLVKGGDWLVVGATHIARKARLSPMVIGITVIGFGTSAPELFVSLQAAIDHSPGLSIGNVVGSNIANIALILGATAAIVPCVSKQRTLRVDMPVMALACVLLMAVGLSGTIGRVAGIVGVLILVGFVSMEVIHSRKEQALGGSSASSLAPVIDEQEEPEQIMALWKAIPLALFSFGLLLLGANLLIKGASDVALRIGGAIGADPKEMERIIGLTIVAVGTSLPELFASVMAARKGESDMAVGNIIGSVTFNIFCGIGLTATICPIEGSDAGFIVDYGLMVVLALLLWLFMRTSRLLERWEGIILLCIYVSYICYTIVS